MADLKLRTVDGPLSYQEIDDNFTNLNTDIANHIADSIDAHDASAISTTPAGNLTSTNVQSSLTEVDSLLSAHIDNLADAHDASAISYQGSTNLSATTVESALDELDTEKAGLNLNNVFTKAQRGSVVALTDAATIAVDLSLSNNYSLLTTSGVGATRVLGNPTNVVAGQSGLIAVTQDGSGSRALTYGSNYKFAGGIAPVLTTTAGAVDYLSYYVETSTRIFISITKDIK
jgi:hypothetical protein